MAYRYSLLFFIIKNINSQISCNNNCKSCLEGNCVECNKSTFSLYLQTDAVLFLFLL